jgi:hypothetical protein
MRALCDAISEHIGREYEQLAAAPRDRPRLLAEVQVSESLQSQLRRAGGLKQQQGQSPPQATRIAAYRRVDATSSAGIDEALAADSLWGGNIGRVGMTNNNGTIRFANNGA